MPDIRGTPSHEIFKLDARVPAQINTGWLLRQAQWQWPSAVAGAPAKLPYPL